MAKKINAKNILGKVLVNAGTGVVVQIAEKAIPVDGKTFGGILAVAGAVLPEVVKNPMVSQIGDAALAIGSYKLADEFDVAGMIGVGNEPVATSGFQDVNMIGKSRTWTPADTVRKPGKQSEAPTNNMNVVQ
jgi:hypothetical protein